MVFSEIISSSDIKNDDPTLKFSSGSIKPSISKSIIFFISSFLLDFNNIKEYTEVINSFKNDKKDNKDHYLGFYNTKTIYKIKK